MSDVGRIDSTRSKVLPFQVSTGADTFPVIGVLAWAGAAGVTRNTCQAKTARVVAGSYRARSV